MKYQQLTAVGVALMAICGLTRVSAPAFAGSATNEFDATMKPVLREYIAIQRALAADSTDGIKQAAEAIGKTAGQLDPGSVTGEHAEHYRSVLTDLQKAATAVTSAPDIESTREAFKELSKPMVMWATMSKVAGIDVLFCSMAKASWLQEHGEVRNPYYGESMLGCGEVVAGAEKAAQPMHHDEHDGGHQTTH